VLRWVRKGGNIGTGVDFLSALRHPGATSVIALVFLTTSERSGDLILILVIILSRRAVGEGRFGHNLGRLDKAILTSTLIY
jgi:hypothetical protein